MTIKEIIDGLKFTVDMFMLDPLTSKVYTEPRNDMDKTTIDACKGAIKRLDKITKLYNKWDSFKISSFDAMAEVGDILRESEDDE